MPGSAADKPVQFRPVALDDLPGWSADAMDNAILSFQRSCAPILKRAPGAMMGGWNNIGGKAKDWQPACRAAASLQKPAPQQVRSFLGQHFRAWWVGDAGDHTGKFTGYYEASLKGSKKPTKAFSYAVYAPPPTLHQKRVNGEQRWGHLINGRFQPYYTRAQIYGGAIRPGKAPVLFWTDNPIDAYFLHVQGSGQVFFTDGTRRHVGFAAKNGQEYVAIGKPLIERGILTPETVSMHSIRKWMEENPAEARPLMEKNPSYIFFRWLPDGGPLGAMGVGLTPERSLAVDRRFIPLGAPMWVDINPNERINRQIRRLMVAQDTGSAILGPIRGDYFWGAGEQAAANAGVMHGEGRWAVLLPKQLDPRR